MVKVILEFSDVEKLIKEKYDCKIVSGLPKEIEITITMDYIPSKPESKKIVQPDEEVKKKEVILGDGSIDADASGLTLKNEGTTTPGGTMRKERGYLPTF